MEHSVRVNWGQFQTISGKIPWVTNSTGLFLALVVETQFEGKL